jgi:DNA-directed RNA polymerase subunit RPC12/RpoP
MLEKLRRFMVGRYGFDELSRFLVILSAIVLLLSNFIFKIVLYPISLIILLLCIYRILSKNHNSRYKENYIYLNYRNILYSKINKVKYNINQRKMYHIFKCPSCRQKVRIPKGKGKVTITCPKCRTEFKKKS